MNEEHYRKLERAYQSARCNDYYDPVLVVSDGEARVSLEAHSKMHHAAKAVHGSVYFKVLDDAAFFAANSLVEDALVLTVSFTIYLMRPIVEGPLEASGRVTHRAGRLFFAESTAVDREGVLIASGSGTFARSKIPLNPDIGYR